MEQRVVKGWPRCPACNAKHTAVPLTQCYRGRAAKPGLSPSRGYVGSRARTCDAATPGVGPESSRPGGMIRGKGGVGLGQAGGVCVVRNAWRPPRGVPRFAPDTRRSTCRPCDTKRRTLSHSATRMAPEKDGELPLSVGPRAQDCPEEAAPTPLPSTLGDLSRTGRSAPS